VGRTDFGDERQCVGCRGRGHCHALVRHLLVRRVLDERRLACDAPAAAYFAELCLRRGDALKACYPADLCDILMWRSQYEGRPPQVTRAELDQAADLYFTRAQN